MLAGQPLIVAGASRVRRSLSVALRGSGQFVHRDTVVLRRHREAPGALHAHTRIERDGVPILDELLDTALPSSYASPAVLGDARVIDALSGFGPVSEPPSGAFVLSPCDTLVRRFGVVLGDELDGVQAAWRQAVLSRAGDRIPPA